MHDYFEILGVSHDARPSEIRACCRRARATHPDIRDGDETPAPRFGGRSGGRAMAARELSDAAIDFVDASAFVDAIRETFFT